LGVILIIKWRSFLHIMWRNVSDLDPEEWFFDTGGYSEINFAAFAMLGKTFCPRIRNIKGQWIYKIREADYGSFNALVKGARHTVHPEAIVDQWDRMGHFYASLEAGFATASTALKRLTGHSEKNLFYKANLQLGRILKANTEAPGSPRHDRKPYGRGETGEPT